MAVEKRSEPRRQVYEAAAVWFGERTSTAGCVVSELSESGCRIQFDNPASLPPAFELSFGENAIIERCEVVWRTDHEVGVRFARS